MNNSRNIIFSCLHSVGVSQKILQKIGENYSNIEDFYRDLCLESGKYQHLFSPKIFARIQSELPKIDFDKRKKYLENQNITLVSIFDDDFPERLRNIYNIPTLLYCKGNIDIQDISLGIVGSRKNTQYSTSILKNLFDYIPYKNVSIISGGAYGVDGLSHRGAIEKNMYTVAVFGCGIDIIYPSSHCGLFEKILENNGGLISSFSLGTKPYAYNFPIRNELVAGLSDTILVPEAATKSGTLITARLALELGKDVCAVPGDIFRATSQGCNELIAKGEARCIHGISDIFEEYQTIQPQIFDIHPINKKENPQKRISQKDSEMQFDCKEARKIYEEIGNGNNTVEGIFKILQLPIDMISMQLTLLEIDRKIIATETGSYQYTS